MTAIGPDRPGLVAALARAVAVAGGNIEDASMSRFRDWFAAMLLVSAPMGFEASLALPDGEGLVTSVRAVGDATQPRAPETATHRLSVYGEDRPAIVATAAEALAAAGANILSLEVDVAREVGAAPLFVMVLDVRFEGDPPAGFAERLASAIGLDVHLVPLEAPIL